MGPFKEAFDRLMKLYPQPPELVAAKAALLEYINGVSQALPAPVPSTVPEYGTSGKKKKSSHASGT